MISGVAVFCATGCRSSSNDAAHVAAIHVVFNIGVRTWQQHNRIVSVGFCATQFAEQRTCETDEERETEAKNKINVNVVYYPNVLTH